MTNTWRGYNLTQVFTTWHLEPGAWGFVVGMAAIIPDFNNDSVWTPQTPGAPGRSTPLDPVESPLFCLAPDGPGSQESWVCTMSWWKCYLFWWLENCTWHCGYFVKLSWNYLEPSLNQTALKIIYVHLTYRWKICFKTAKTNMSFQIQKGYLTAVQKKSQQRKFRMFFFHLVAQAHKNHQK